MNARPAGAHPPPDATRPPESVVAHPTVGRLPCLHLRGRFPAQRSWRLGAFLALALTAGVLALLASASPSFGWDEPIAKWITAIDVPGFSRAMELVSLPGTTLGIPLTIAAAASVVLWRRGWREAVLVMTIIVLVGANEGLKALIGRPRPGGGIGIDHDSFPSGHVFESVILLGMLWVVLVAPGIRGVAARRTLAIAMVGAAVLIGVSRVFLERHWPSDILGGYLFGGLALWGLLWARERFLSMPTASPETVEPEEGEGD